MLGVAPRGILFDAYGTLFDVHSLTSLADRLFPGRGAELSRLWRDRQMDYSRLRTLCGSYVDFLSVTEDALKHACERLGLPLTDPDCARFLDEYQRLAAHADVRGVLERLRALGMPLAILSNGTAAMLESAVRTAGFAGWFGHVLSADRVRKFKTAPEVYQLGVDAFGCAPEDLLFVSSNCWDACCATGFGYRTFWVNRLGDPVDRLGWLPTGSGATLGALLEFMGVT